MKLSDINVTNPATGGKIGLTNPMGIVKLFGGAVLLYAMAKLAMSFGDKLLGKTSKYTAYGQKDPNPYANISVV